MGEEVARQVAEVRWILWQRARAQDRRPLLQVEHPRRAVATRSLALRHHQAERRIGRGAELLRVEGEHALDLLHLLGRLPPRARQRVAAHRELAFLAQADVGHPAHHRRDELARPRHAELAAGAAAARARSDLLAARHAEPALGRVEHHAREREVLVRRARVPGRAVGVDDRRTVEEHLLAAIGIDRARDLDDLLVDAERVVPTRVACHQRERLLAARERPERHHERALVAHAEEQQVAAVARLHRAHAEVVVEPQPDGGGRVDEPHPHAVGRGDLVAVGIEPRADVVLQHVERAVVVLAVARRDAARRVAADLQPAVALEQVHVLDLGRGERERQHSLAAVREVDHDVGDAGHQPPRRARQRGVDDEAARRALAEDALRLRAAPTRARVRLERLRRDQALELGRVQAHERPVHLALERRLSPELPQLLALGNGRGGEAHAALADEHEQRGSDRLGRREQRSVLESQLEFPLAQAQAARAERLRPEREVHEAVHLADLLPRHHGPARRTPLDPQRPEDDAGARLGRDEDLRLDDEARVAGPRGRAPQQREHHLVGREPDAQRLLLELALVGRLELAQRQPAGDVAGLERRVEPIQERRQGGVRGGWRSVLGLGRGDQPRRGEGGDGQAQQSGRAHRSAREGFSNRPEPPQ